MKKEDDCTSNLFPHQSVMKAKQEEKRNQDELKMVELLKRKEKLKINGALAAIANMGMIIRR